MANRLSPLPPRILLFAVLVATAAVAQEPTTDRVHAVGYSVTVNAICGTTGLFFLDATGQECRLYAEYGGGTLPHWFEDLGPPRRGRWLVFESGVQINRTPALIYWQIGFRNQKNTKLKRKDLSKLLDILDVIRARAPGAVIYVSGMSDYSPNNCSSVNAKAVTKSWNAAGALWATEPDVYMGPVMPTITPAQTAGSDPCHLGPQGALEHGALLHAFFDPLMSP